MIHQPKQTAEPDRGPSALGALLLGQLAITVIWGACIIPLAALVLVAMKVVAVAPVLGGALACASVALFTGVSFWVGFRFFLPAFLEFLKGALFAIGPDRLSLTKVDEILQGRLRDLRADIATLRNLWRA